MKNNWLNELENDYSDFFRALHSVYKKLDMDHMDSQTCLKKIRSVLLKVINIWPGW